MNDSPSPSPRASLPRRRFLVRISLGFSALAGAAVGLPAIGFIFRGMFRKLTPAWRDLGPIAQFPPNQTVKATFETVHRDTWSQESANAGAWIRRDDADHFTAFSMHCTHMGCPVRWQPEALLFMCPCHGGVFNADGTVAAGPPQLPLARYPLRIRGGHLQLNTQPVPDRRA